MTCPTCGGTCFVQFDLLDADWCPTCDGSGRVESVDAKPERSTAGDDA
jgi:DnaJ-class molecular chaperone